MTHPAPTYATLDDWIAREAIPFSLNSPETFNAAVDRSIEAASTRYSVRTLIGRILLQ